MERRQKGGNVQKTGPRRRYAVEIPPDSQSRHTATRTGAMYVETRQPLGECNSNRLVAKGLEDEFGFAKRPAAGQAKGGRGQNDLQSISRTEQNIL